MKVLLLYPNIQSEQMPPTSIAIFSAILKQEGFEGALFDSTDYDVETEFVDADGARRKLVSAERTKMANLNVRPFPMLERERKTTSAYDDFRRLAEAFNPDLIAVTATENMFPMTINLLQHVDDLDTPVVLGGVFATFAPELALRWKEIDMLCVGEGEDVFRELCRRLSRGQDYADIPGLWVRDKQGAIVRNGIAPLTDKNANPLPDFSIFPDGRFYRPMAGKIWRIFPIETHRGCPFTCSYCNSPAQSRLYKSAGQRFFGKKTLDKVREEIVWCRDVWKAEYFFFWADTFFSWTDKELAAFCEMYSEFKLPFWCQSRPETVTEQRIQLLKDAGVNRMGFGIEHGNEAFRREIVKRDYRNEAVVKRMKILGALGVEFSVNNMIGFPDETRELAFDTIRLNRQVASDTMSCSIFVPFHGTGLREMAVERGYLHPDTICPTNSDDSVLHMPPPYMSGEDMKRLRRCFVMYCKFPEERWPEIREAEEFTPQGDAKWHELRKEFEATFFAPPETDIEKVNAVS
ncbi:MAG: radical SAM protein [Patescibacteria group bacterium]